MRIILILLFTVLTSCVLPQTKKESTNTVASKIWEQEAQVVKKIKNVRLILTKDFSRNIIPNTFYISGSDLSLPISGDFHGNCSEHVSIVVRPNDIRQLNLDKFLKTRRGEDLPISNFLYAMKETLTEQCEQLQVIRVNFKPAFQTKKNYSYEGTMIKANNWKLQDGKIKTAYDSSHTFNLLLPGFQYQGNCEQNPLIPLKFQSGNLQKSLGQTIRSSDYTFMTGTITERYLKECSAVKTIKYTVIETPKGYFCPRKKKCYFIASKNSNWDVRIEGFEIKKSKLYDKNVWGSICKGDYCDLPGGLYLNAIYNNDMNLIRKLDRAVNPARKTIGAPDQSLLDHLARYYMYSSSEFNPRPGMVNKTISYKADSHEIYDENGAYTGRGGGEVFSTTYIISTELVSLCERVCKHINPHKAPSEQAFKQSNKAVSATIAGIIKIRDNENHNLAKIRKFERNLASLTNQFLNSKASWLIRSE